MPSALFKYFTFNVTDHLPNNWQAEIRRVASEKGKLYNLTANSVTSRESSLETVIPALTVGGVEVISQLPWLDALYRGLFRDIGQGFFSEPIKPAGSNVYSVNLNIQRGATMRYECHVDSNPVQCMLYATSHKPGEGGELVVSHNEQALGCAEIDVDCTIIYPQAGQLVFFDARRHPHYVKPLVRSSDERIAVAMNYYTPSSPEGDRPPDLTAHLLGHDAKA